MHTPASQLIRTLNGDGRQSLERPGRNLLLSEVMDVDKLASHVLNGLVTKRDSEDGVLSIYKYSKTVHINGEWDEVTLNTRGLIVNNETGEVIARGLNKFFSSTQLEELYGIYVDVNEEASVFPKEDGSLGIAYYHDDKWAVATAGSFNSEMAIHATKKFNELYRDVEPIKGRTFLFEIIYPENRIVTDYGDKDDLIFLCATDQFGKWISPEEYSDLPFSRSMVTATRTTVGEAEDAVDPEDTSEGFIIRTDSGLIIKYKHPSYLRLHKQKFNLNTRVVWENVKNPEAWEKFIYDIPDEFQNKVLKLGFSFMKEYRELSKAVDSYAPHIAEMERKDKAVWVRDNVPPELSRLVMAKLVAGQDIEELLWKAVKPSKANPIV